MSLERNCYAICTTSEPGVFSDEYIVTLGDSSEELLVDKRSMGFTPSGLVAVKFTILNISDGMARGIACNCQDGSPSGQRNVPIDSLATIRQIKPYLRE